jgi:hypothetical protein
MTWSSEQTGICAKAPTLMRRERGGGGGGVGGTGFLLHATQGGSGPTDLPHSTILQPPCGYGGSSAPYTLRMHFAHLNIARTALPLPLDGLSLCTWNPVASSAWALASWPGAALRKILFLEGAVTVVQTAQRALRKQVSS